MSIYVSLNVFISHDFFNPYIKCVFSSLNISFIKSFFLFLGLYDVSLFSPPRVIISSSFFYPSLSSCLHFFTSTSSAFSLHSIYFFPLLCHYFLRSFRKILWVQQLYCSFGKTVLDLWLSIYLCHQFYWYLVSCIAPFLNSLWYKSFNFKIVPLFLICTLKSFKFSFCIWHVWLYQFTSQIYL